MKLGTFHGYYCPFRERCKAEVGGGKALQCASCTKLDEKLKLAFSSINSSIKKDSTMENKIYLGNAFSLQMLDEFPVFVKVSSVDEKEVFYFHKGDVLYVAQLMGGRLPEGCTTLPEGYSFKYLKVELL